MSTLSPAATDPGTRAHELAAAIPGVTLGRRLATFRATRAGRDPGPAGRAAVPDLADRLASAVGGTVVGTPRGRVVRIDAGSVEVPVDRERLQGLPDQPPADRRLVCLDTETTGLSTGTGTVAWAVGIGTWSGGTLTVTQLLLPDHPDEGALLDAVGDEIGDAPVLVTYNGRSFDWPLLVARYRAHGRPAPVLAGHLDLLPVVRRLFRHRLGDARLRRAEEGLLALTRHDDVEGWAIPSLYLDFLRGGPAAPLARVAAHNAEDVRSLARLLAHIDGSLADPGARPAADPGDLASLAEMLRLAGRHPEALACLDHALRALRDRDRPDLAGTVRLGYPLDRTALQIGAPAAIAPWRSPRSRHDIGDRSWPAPSGSDRIQNRGGPVDLATVLAARARILRRLGHHAEAAATWEEVAAVAGAFGVAAWIEVAKIREHVERDPAGALEATDRAITILSRRRAAGRPDHVAEARAARRRARLARRLRRAHTTGRIRRE